MQTIFKTTSHILLKSSVAAIAVASLLASGTTTGDGPGADIGITYSGVVRDGNAKSATAKSNTILLSKTGYNEFTIDYKGKAYILTAADQYQGNTNLYNKVFGDLEFSVQDISKDLFEKKHSHSTDDAELWQIAIEDPTNNQVEIGFQVYGIDIKTLPTNAVNVYKGRMQGYSVGKTDPNDHYWLNGELNLTADFNIGKQTISGKIDNMTTIKLGQSQSNPSASVITFVDAKITDGKFTGTLALHRNGQASNLVSSSVSGAFYGDGAAEVGGLGSLESDTFTTAFGFTGKK